MLNTEIPTDGIAQLTPRELWQQLHNGKPPLVIDVREPREFQRGHIPQAKLYPLSKLEKIKDLPEAERIVLICHGGRRSARVAQLFRAQGYCNVAVLQGGMVAWEAAGLLEAFVLPQVSCPSSSDISYRICPMVCTLRIQYTVFITCCFVSNSGYDPHTSIRSFQHIGPGDYSISAQIKCRLESHGGKSSTRRHPYRPRYYDTQHGSRN